MLAIIGAAGKTGSRSGAYGSFPQRWNPALPRGGKPPASGTSPPCLGSQSWCCVATSKAIDHKGTFIVLRRRLFAAAPKPLCPLVWPASVTCLRWCNYMAEPTVASRVVRSTCWFWAQPLEWG